MSERTLQMLPVDVQISVLAYLAPGYLAIFSSVCPQSRRLPSLIASGVS
jgi:hypothetical protein